MKKPNLNDVLRMCEQLKGLVTAIFTKPEIHKGDKGKWRGKARKLLRRISEAL